LPLFYSLILRANDFTNRPVIAINGIGVLTIYLGLAALLIWSVLRGHVAGTFAALAALTLIVVDLFSATATFNPSTDDVTAGFRHPEVANYLLNEWQISGPFRIEAATARWQPNTAAVIGIDDIGGTFDPMQLRDYSAVRDAATSNRNLPLYDALNAQFLITDADAEIPGPKFREVLRSTDGLILWENQQVLPRAWLVGEAELVDSQTALARIREPEFNPQSIVYLSDGGSPLDNTGTPTGSVSVSQPDPNSVKISATTDRSAYLVLAQTAYPGWNATLDGQPAKLMTANGVFQAVEVPSGSHEVSLRFTPRHLTLAVDVSVVGVVLAFGMLLLGWRERHPRREAA
ncbi:MAG: YfhO family protein, partial [Solirubrobacterales bacterium]|nr:YfhO family protein [Solirubrobacterales bacterium]